MSYWQESVRQEAIGLIDSLSRGEPRERDVSLFARRYNAQSLGDLIKRIGLSPRDFSELDLSPKVIWDRGEEFVRTGRGFGRLRLWVRELTSICMLPAYLTSPSYRAPVDRSLRLLHLVLDPVLVPDRADARRLTRLVMGYLQTGRPGVGPHVVCQILRSQREATLVTYQTGVPDRSWADIALVVGGPGRKRASWFVPLTVITREFDQSSAQGRSGEREDGAWPSEISGAVSSAAELGSPRLYEITGKGRPALLSYHVDRDGLSWVKCWTEKLDRGYLRLAASLFCAATGIRKAQLDGEALKTSLG